ncbi:hypothetical protein B0H11DRAFT_2228347 [Mycena galericulata]|nr:hypothetical protein B0H11DRAFT_2228347 [Mycena galericulata]
MVSWNKFLGVASVAAATALLAVVAFDVPYIKSVYFIRIDFGNGTTSTTLPTNHTSLRNQTKGYVDLGVLGFCTDLLDGRGLRCLQPKIGYNLSDASVFVNINTTQPGNIDSVPIAIPSFLTNGVDKVTTTLTKVLIVHLGISLVPFVFALLAFLGAPIAECCSSCFSGFAGSATLAVFIFDVVFFNIIQKRINAEGSAGTALLGNAMFFTLITFILLFVTPLLFLLGRCCGWCMDVHSDEPRDEKRRQYA